MKLCKWGEGKHASWLQASKVVFLLALVDLVHQQQRHVTNGRFPRSRQKEVRVCHVPGIGECRICDCEENGKTVVVAPITARSHRLVVMPEVCASGWRDTAATARDTYDTSCYCPADASSWVLHCCCPLNSMLDDAWKPVKIQTQAPLSDKLDPHFWVRGVPTTISEHGS